MAYNLASHDLSTTLLLAELNLRGQGVSKNLSEAERFLKEAAKNFKVLPGRAEDNSDIAKKIDALQHELADARLKATVCNYCGSLARMRCTHCKQVFYCDRQCQKKDAQVHKTFCQPPAIESLAQLADGRTSLHVANEDIEAGIQASIQAMEEQAADAIM